MDTALYKTYLLHGPLCLNCCSWSCRGSVRTPRVVYTTTKWDSVRRDQRVSTCCHTRPPTDTGTSWRTTRTWWTERRSTFTSRRSTWLDKRRWRWGEHLEVDLIIWQWVVLSSFIEANNTWVWAMADIIVNIFFLNHGQNTPVVRTNKGYWYNI